MLLTTTRNNNNKPFVFVVYWSCVTLLWLLLTLNNIRCHAFNPLHSFHHHHKPNNGVAVDKPKLILIGGSPGTGKSTFGMSVALDQNILRCISTDTIRAVMRSFVPADVSPQLHRSSYAPAFADDNDPVRSWKECCNVLQASIETLVEDAMRRNVSLVVEGVHLIPSRKLIDKWQQCGGAALGVLLQVQDPVTHKALLQRRGVMTGNMQNEHSKIESYERIRIIQDEMMRLAKESGWLLIEQKVEPDPLEMVTAQLLQHPNPHIAGVDDAVDHDHEHQLRRFSDQHHHDDHHDHDHHLPTPTSLRRQEPMILNGSTPSNTPPQYHTAAVDGLLVFHPKKANGDVFS